MRPLICVAAAAGAICVFNVHRIAEIRVSKYTEEVNNAEVDEAGADKNRSHVFKNLHIINRKEQLEQPECLDEQVPAHRGISAVTVRGGGVRLTQLNQSYERKEVEQGIGSVFIERDKTPHTNSKNAH